MTEAEYDRILDSIAGERAEIPAVNPYPLTTEPIMGKLRVEEISLLHIISIMTGIHAQSHVPVGEYR